MACAQSIDYMSSVEIKPATNGRNYPASEFVVRGYEKRGHFSFKRTRYQRLTAGLVGTKMLTYAEYRGWVISTIRGWMEVAADIHAEGKRFYRW